MRLHGTVVWRAVQWIAPLVLGAVMLGAVASAQEMAPIRSGPGALGERMTPIAAGLNAAADAELWARFQARLAPSQPGARGEVWFVMTVEFAGAAGEPVRMTARVPIASTEDAYGESRSCSAGRELVFTAGLDEANFVDFRAAQVETHSFSFLLNKYLCRMLAAPFRCDGRPVELRAGAQDMRRWRVISVGLAMHGDGSVVVEASPVAVERGGAAFDYAKCAEVAPSSGLCCVQGKETQWSCGVAPDGEGWHQVSGECFHRETGGSCKQ